MITVVVTLTYTVDPHASQRGERFLDASKGLSPAVQLAHAEEFRNTLDHLNGQAYCGRAKGLSSLMALASEKVSLARVEHHTIGAP